MGSCYSLAAEHAKILASGAQTRQTHRVALWLMLLLFAAAPADAARLVRVIARAVGYDTNLKQRTHDKVTIAVLMSARSPDSMSHGEAMSMR